MKPMHIKTQVYRLNPQNIAPATIRMAGKTIREGGLVAFPTETVYGLGANALDAEAVARIFAAKDRPASDPIIVHIAALEMLAEITPNPPPLLDELSTAFWPGPLTVILPRGLRIPSLVSAGRETVGVRIPSHPIARALLDAAEVPIAAPSANRFARPSATQAHHVMQDLNGRIDMLLDGGSTTIGLESTVLDLTADPARILRPGGVTLEALRAIIPDVVYQARYLALEDDAPQSPGQLLKHYAPDAELRLYQGTPKAARAAMRQSAKAAFAAGRRVGIIVYEEDRAHFADLAMAQVQLGADDVQIGARLFAALRDLEAQGVDMILARDPAPQGLGLAIWDRLVRAAEGQIINVDEA